MSWRKRLTESKSKAYEVSFECLFVAALGPICQMKTNEPQHQSWAGMKDLHSKRRRQRTVIIQMENVSQGRACFTQSKCLQCGCFQERHFKGTTAIILKSASETGDASYLGNASFSTMTIKRVPPECVDLYCRSLKMVRINIQIPYNSMIAQGSISRAGNFPLDHSGLVRVVPSCE